MPYLEVIGKYADFGGRAARREYWPFKIVDTVIRIALTLLVWTVSWWFMILLGIYLVALFLPNWSVSVRRLHDTGRSGWWLLLWWVPFGAFVLFFFYLSGSDGPNDYGPEPR